MSSVAFLLCAGFVFFLLRLERRASPGSSLALWIPTIWMMIIASRPLATWFVASQVSVPLSNESGSPLDRWVLAGLSLAALAVLFLRQFDWAGALRRHKWLLVLLAYMLLSTLWSDISLIALKRWAREWIVIVMALLIMSELNPRQALASVLRRAAYVLVPFSVVLIKYYPRLGRQYGHWSGVEMWTGVTGQKNELGRLCALSVFFLLWTLFQNFREHQLIGRRYHVWADVCVLVIALYLLFGSNSSTSLATLIAGVASLLGMFWYRKFGLKIPRAGLSALVIVLIVFGASTPFVGGANVGTFSATFGRDNTLTGRTEVWKSVLPAMEQQALGGYGYSSFWTDARRQLYEIPTAHNGYLDVLLELGAIGLAFFSFWLWSCAGQLHRALKENYEWASFAIWLLVMTLIYNITESALNSLTDYMTASVVLVCLVVPYRSKLASGRGRHETLA